MYKHENIAEIKILLNPFTCDSEKKRRQHRQQSGKASFLLPASCPSPRRSKEKNDAQRNALLI